MQTRNYGDNESRRRSEELARQATQDYTDVSTYFHGVIERMRQEGQLTEERISVAYHECAQGIRNEGREDLLPVLEEIVTSYLVQFRQLQSDTSSAIHRVVGQYVAQMEEPPSSPPPDRPEGSEPPESGENFLSDLDEIDQKMAGLVAHSDALEQRINADHTQMRPETYQNVQSIHSIIVGLIRTARENGDGARSALARGVPAERIRVTVETFRQTTELIETQIQSLDVLVESVLQIARADARAQQQELADRMGVQHEQRTGLQRRREQIREKIQGRGDGLNALLNSPRSKEKIQASFLLEVEQEFARAFEGLVQLDSDVVGMTFPQDVNVLRESRARYDEILGNIERQLSRAEEVFASLPSVIILSRPAPEQRPSPPARQSSSKSLRSESASPPLRQSSPKPRRVQYDYENRPPRGRRLDYRTGEPLPDTPILKLWKRITSWFGRD